MSVYRSKRHRPLVALLALGLLAPLGLLASLGLVAPLGNTAQGQETDRLKEIETTIAREEERVKSLDIRAEDLAVEMDRLQAELVTTAGLVQEREAELVKLEKLLIALESSEAEKIDGLGQRRDELGRLITALERLALQPREALFLGWQSPLDTVLTAQLLRYTVPPLEEKAKRLRRELDEIADLRGETARRREEISRATASLRSARDAVGRLVRLKASLRKSTEADRLGAAERLQALAEQADDLRDLLTAVPTPVEPPADEAGGGVTTPNREGPAPAAIIRLERPENVKSFPSRANGLTPPVRGSLVAGYDTEFEDGTKNRGLFIETLPEAQVVAPHDGQVVFRGPFRGYGQLLIIEHRGGYHTLLAGLGRMDAVVGQWLLAGEPVGIMQSPRAGRPRLYVELRRDGRPVDPWPWLEAHISKVE